MPSSLSNPLASTVIVALLGPSCVQWLLQLASENQVTSDNHRMKSYNTSSQPQIQVLGVQVASDQDASSLWQRREHLSAFLNKPLLVFYARWVNRRIENLESSPWQKKGRFSMQIRGRSFWAPGRLVSMVPQSPRRLGLYHGLQVKAFPSTQLQPLGSLQRSPIQKLPVSRSALPSKVPSCSSVFATTRSTKCIWQYCRACSHLSRRHTGMSCPCPCPTVHQTL